MATNKKGKTSKKGSGKVKVIDYTKKERKKKEYIYIEQTLENIGKITTVEEGIKSYYEGKPIIALVERYGKKYFKVKNEVEQEISAI